MKPSLFSKTILPQNSNNKPKPPFSHSKHTQNYSEKYTKTSVKSVYHKPKHPKISKSKPTIPHSGSVNVSNSSKVKSTRTGGVLKSNKPSNPNNPGQKRPNKAWSSARDRRPRYSSNQPNNGNSSSVAPAVASRSISDPAPNNPSSPWTTRRPSNNPNNPSSPSNPDTRNIPYQQRMLYKPARPRPHTSTGHRLSRPNQSGGGIGETKDRRGAKTGPRPTGVRGSRERAERGGHVTEHRTERYRSAHSPYHPRHYQPVSDPSPGTLPAAEQAQEHPDEHSDPDDDCCEHPLHNQAQPSLRPRTAPHHYAAANPNISETPTDRTGGLGGIGVNLAKMGVFERVELEIGHRERLRRFQKHGLSDSEIGFYRPRPQATGVTPQKSPAPHDQPDPESPDNLNASDKLHTETETDEQVDSPIPRVTFSPPIVSAGEREMLRIPEGSEESSQNGEPDHEDSTAVSGALSGSWEEKEPASRAHDHDPHDREMTHRPNHPPSLEGEAQLEGSENPQSFDELGATVTPSRVHEPSRQDSSLGARDVAIDDSDDSRSSKSFHDMERGPSPGELSQYIERNVDQLLIQSHALSWEPETGEQH